MKQQDEKLDVLLDGVNMLQGITKDMTSALDEDAELLKGLDDDVQRTQGRLESVVKRVDTLLDSVAGILIACLVFWMGWDGGDGGDNEGWCSGKRFVVVVNRKS